MTAQLSWRPCSTPKATTTTASPHVQDADGAFPDAQIGSLVYPSSATHDGCRRRRSSSSSNRTWMKRTPTALARPPCGCRSGGSSWRSRGATTLTPSSTVCRRRPTVCGPLGFRRRRQQDRLSGRPPSAAGGADPGSSTSRRRSSRASRVLWSWLQASPRAGGAADERGFGGGGGRLSLVGIVGLEGGIQSPLSEFLPPIA